LDFNAEAEGFNGASANCCVGTDSIACGAIATNFGSLAPDLWR
jgi:hypothetical protein